MHIAFVAHEFAGHLLPHYALLRHRHMLGDKVTLVIPKNAEWFVKLLAADAVFYPTPIKIDQRNPPSPSVRSNQIVETAAVDINASSQTIRDILLRLKPDLVMFDSFSRAALVAAKSARLPALALSVSFLSNSALDQFLVQNGLHELSDSPSLQAVEAFESQIRDKCLELDLPPLAWNDLLLPQACACLVHLPSSYYPLSNLISHNVLLAGPTSAIERIDESRCSQGFEIVLNLGTLFAIDPALIECVYHVLGRLGRRVIIGAGPQIDFLNTLRKYPAIEIKPWIDQIKYVQSARLLISHGGTGSVMEALVAGIPILAIPGTKEHSLNGYLIEQMGLGLTIAPSTVSEETITNALNMLTTEKAFMNASQQFSQVVRAESSIDLASQFVQSAFKFA